MKKKLIIPFLFIGLTFSIGSAIILFQQPIPHPNPLAAHPWSTLSKIDELKTLLKGFNIHSLIDTSCEEAALIPQLDIHLDHYIGVNRHKEIIEGIRGALGSAERSFIARDMSRETLPQADMIICWDLFQTFAPSQVRSTIHQLKKSEIKYLLVSHYPDLQSNPKAYRGGHRPINWMLSPYNFPVPMIQISECKENGQTKSLALWKISELP